MKPVQLAPRCTRMVVARDREMDTRRVDVGKGVKRQGRLMRDDTTAQSPGDGRSEIVVFTARQHRHPVHTAAGMFKTPPSRKQAKLRRIDADLPRVTSCDVAMLLGSDLDKPIPDGHVRNRIK